jgi:hypothetical protein
MICFSRGLNGWQPKLVIGEITQFMDEHLPPQQCKVSTKELSIFFFQKALIEEGALGSIVG